MNFIPKELENYLNKKIDELSSFKIPSDFRGAYNSKKQLEKIQQDIDNKTGFIDKTKINDKLYNLYSRLTILINALLNDVNKVIIMHLSNFYIKMTKKQKQNEKNIIKIQHETKKILPQIITFSSLFIAVIGLIIANVNIISNFSLKSLLLINLSFILAISIIFFLFCLLWSDYLIKQDRKIIVFSAFTAVIVFTIVAIICIACYMH